MNNLRKRKGHKKSWKFTYLDSIMNSQIKKLRKLKLINEV